MCFAKPDDLPSMTFDWFGLPADMIAHFLMFIPFPVLAYFAFVPERYGKSRKFLCMMAIAFTAAAMALATEKVQELLGYDGRHGGLDPGERLVEGRPSP